MHSKFKDELYDSFYWEIHVLFFFVITHCAISAWKSWRQKCFQLGNNLLCDKTLCIQFFFTDITNGVQVTFVSNIQKSIEQISLGACDKKNKRKWSILCCCSHAKFTVSLDTILQSYIHHNGNSILLHSNFRICDFDLFIIAFIYSFDLTTAKAPFHSEVFAVWCKVNFTNNNKTY